MKIYPSSLPVLLPPTSILKVLRSQNLTFPKDNVAEFVALHLKKLNSNQALQVLSNLISQGLVQYEDAEYEVECIEDHTWDEQERAMYYLVKWRGWPAECNTWEPEADLTNCSQALANYRNGGMNGNSRKRAASNSSTSSSTSSTSDAASAAASERSKARVVELLDCINFDGLTPERFESALAEALSRRALLSVSRPSRRTQLVQHVAGLLTSKRSRAYRNLAAKAHAELKGWERHLNSLEPGARIVVENKVDTEGPPCGFVYVTQRVPGPGVEIPADPVLGCACTNCWDQRRECVASHMHNEGRVPYNRQGRLPNVSASYPIHECNSLCACGPDCPFRVVQHGRRAALAIFRTPNRGWGVRTLQRIHRGSFVVEYVGEVVTSEEAERRGLEYDREGQTYLFDLDLDGEPVYSVDARDHGNVSHFLNHSCSPNLTIRCVYTQCIHKDLPLLALFAAEPIPSGAELTFDYQMSGAVGAANGEEATGELASGTTTVAPVAAAAGPAKIRCLCGAQNCRRFLFD